MSLCGINGYKWEIRACNYVYESVLVRLAAFDWSASLTFLFQQLLSFFPPDFFLKNYKKKTNKLTILAALNQYQKYWSQIHQTWNSQDSDERRTNDHDRDDDDHDDDSQEDGIEMMGKGRQLKMNVNWDSRSAISDAEMRGIILF